MPNLRQQPKASNALNLARPRSATQRQDARFYHDPRLGPAPGSHVRQLL